MIVDERSVICRAVSAIVVVQNFPDFFQLLFKDDDVGSNASDSVTFLKVFVDASHLTGRVAARFALQKNGRFIIIQILGVTLNGLIYTNKY